MLVKDIIDICLSNPSLEIKGFRITGYGSWRGEYDKPCIYIQESLDNITSAELIHTINKLTSGEEFHGYKGGTYTYDANSELHFEPKPSAWTDGYYDEIIYAHLNQTKDLISSIGTWFEIAKPKPTNENLIQQIAYHFEEFAEMCESLGDEFIELTSMVNKWKANLLVSASVPEQADKFVANIDKLALLDSLADQVVTATGVAKFAGMDFINALNEVNNSNYTKFDIKDGKYIPYIKENGKIGKNPNTYKEPQLSGFIKK